MILTEDETERCLNRKLLFTYKGNNSCKCTNGLLNQILLPRGRNGRKCEIQSNISL